MSNPLPWKQILDGIEGALTQVEAAAALRESLIERTGPPPLAPDSSWQAELHAWDLLVAELPAAAEEAERECHSTEALLGEQEQALQAWLRAIQEDWQELAAWDKRHVAAAAHTIRAT